MIYKTGIVGCGRIGSEYDVNSDGKNIYSHAGAYAANPNTTLISACDIDSEKLKQFSERWGINKRNLYQDYRKMLRVEELDILSVCTHPDSHYDIIKCAVENGVKIIFCEKPISDNIENAEKIVKLCEKEGVTLAVNHLRRYVESHQKIKELIDNGGIGEVNHVTCDYVRGIRNYGTHIIDLIRYLFGEVNWVWANNTLKEDEKDKSLDCFLLLEKGFSCVLNSYDRKYIDLFNIEIYGSKGKISIKNFGDDITIHKTKTHPIFKDSIVFEKNGMNFMGYKGTGSAMVNAIYDLIESHSNNKPPLCTGGDGLTSLKVVNAIEKSAEKGGIKISI